MCASKLKENTVQLKISINLQNTHTKYGIKLFGVVLHISVYKKSTKPSKNKYAHSRKFENRRFMYLQNIKNCNSSLIICFRIRFVQKFKCSKYVKKKSSFTLYFGKTLDNLLVNLSFYSFDEFFTFKLL